MSMSTSKSDATNAKMVRFVPELASEYAKYPMKYSRWFDPKEKDPKGKPCWIKSETDVGLKPDYVFGAGKFGRGYYHIMTIEAYQNLYARLMSEFPGGCCYCFISSARKEVDEYDDVKRIVYNRSVASVPDDGVAAKDAISKATDTAQAWHNGLQNEQLVVGAIQLNAI
jgi:hypothetical protein